MRRRILLSAALATIGVSSSAIAAPRDLLGLYTMAGKSADADDSPYSGTCTLKAQADYYDVSCFNTAAKHTYVGRGMMVGDQFSILIGDVLRGDHEIVYKGEYLVVYKLAADGSLKGHWVHAIADSHGEETLTPKK